MMESEKSTVNSNLKDFDRDNETQAQSIENIPSDVLLPILSSLPYKDRLVGARVSSRWHRIIDERVGRKLFIGRPCQFTPSDEERFKHRYAPIEAIEGVGANTIYFGEVEHSKDALNPLLVMFHNFWEYLYGPKLPSFKNPNLVQNVFFDGPIPAEYFRSVMRPLRCLERLDLHTSALAHLSLEDLNLPHLKRLGIINVWGHRMTQGVFSKFFDQKPIVSNLLEIWNTNYFPSLTKMSVEYPFDFSKEYVLTEKLLEFLERHKRTLEDLRLIVSSSAVEEDTESDDSPFVRRWTDTVKAAARQLSLKHVELEIISLIRVLLFRLWVFLVEELSTLETISILSLSLNASILEKVSQKNFQTLKKITLSRLTFADNLGHFRSIPFSSIQSCNKLESLTIDGTQYWDNTIPEGTQAGMTGAENIPQSLKHLELTGIILKSEDTHYILTQLMNLQKVFLNSTGHGRGYGVTTATVQEIISIRRIREVSLFHCLIDGIPEGGFPVGNPTNPSAVIKGERSLRSSGGYIHMELAEDGYYKQVARRQLTINLEQWEED